MTQEAIFEEWQRLSQGIEDDIEALKIAGEEWAHADNTHRVARAQAYVRAVGKNREKREAEADPQFADQRLAANLAEAHKEVCLEKVRGRRAQLSAFQTIVAARRAEAEAFGYGQLTGGGS